MTLCLYQNSSKMALPVFIIIDLVYLYSVDLRIERFQTPEEQNKL